MKIEKFNVTGMTCSACVAHVEKSVRKLNGVQDVTVNLLTNSMSVEFEDTALSADEIVNMVQDAGYDASLKQERKAKAHEPKIDYAAKEQEELRQRIVYSFLFLIPLMYIAMGPMLGLPLTAFLAGESNALILAFTQFLLTIPVFFINRSFFIHGFRSLFQLSPTMDALVAIGSSAALVYGIFAIYRISFGFSHADMAIVHRFMHDIFFESGATILTLITLGKYLEARSKRRTSDALTKLIDSSPQTATVIRNGEETEIPVEEVVLNDLISIRPGQKIPVDGKVEEGVSSVDESAITGESIPVMKQTGDMVISGSINTTGFIKFRATRVGDDTTLSQIIHLLEDATASKAPISRLADQISRIFVPSVIAIALIATAVWLILGYSFEFSLSIGIAVLIISCPCALGLATPVAIMVGTGKGAENGVLFKSAEALEIGGKIDTIVFDKTGTVTVGNPQLTDVVALHYLDESELMRVVASLEKLSEHPISKAIITHAEALNLTLYEASDFESVPGKGITGKVKGEQYKVGNKAYIGEDIDFSEVEDYLFQLAQQGKTSLFVADDEQILGVIGVADVLKPTSHEAIELLKTMGMTTIMLTGDNRRTAQAIQAEIGFDKVIAEVFPQDKDSVIRQLQSEGHKVAMVGDGINDAPALARADLGIAVSSGTDIAIESADVILMKNDLLDVVSSIRLSKSVIRNIKENLFWAFFYNVIGIPVAAGLFYFALGWKLNPMIAALAMSLSSVTVVSNALRLKSFKFSNKHINRLKTDI